MSKLPDDRRSIFADVYGFYERHWDMPDTTEAWTEAAREMGAVSVRHGNSPLAMNLLMAVYDTIDKEFKAVREALR